VATTETTLEEVHRYLPLLARKKALDLEDLLIAFATLPIQVYHPAFYASRIAQAKKLIGDRDPDDVPLLALALALDAPVWSNDRDFEGLGHPVFTTGDLLMILFG
jgi:predicted nucleic acid-binding protein